jgi:hypothetical protein
MITDVRRSRSASYFSEEQRTRCRSYAGAIFLSLGWAVLIGCSTDEPGPAANQVAQGNAGGGAAPMQPPGGMPAGGMQPPGGMPGMAAGGPMPPGGSSPADTAIPAGAPGATAGTPTVPMPGAAPIPAAGLANAAPMPNAAGAPPGGAAGGALPIRPGAQPMPPGAQPMPPGEQPMPPGAQPMPPGGRPMPPGEQPMPPGGRPGVAAGFDGGSSTPTNPVSPVGSAEYSAEKVVVQLLSGSVSGLEEFISPKCKGPLADVREGKASDKQIEEMKKLFQGLQPVGKPRKESGATVLSVKNADGTMITFRIKKEEESFKVIEMTVKPASTKRSR